jgi:hypothetical protein
MVLCNESWGCERVADTLPSVGFSRDVEKIPFIFMEIRGYMICRKKEV